MKALVKTARGVGNLELREVPEPKNADNEVLIEIKAARICGTDIHVKHDEFPYWPSVLLGPAFAAEVVAVGPAVRDRQAPSPRQQSGRRPAQYDRLFTLC